jgi:hypothetical protein
MSSSTSSKLPASAPTVLELGNRRSLEVSRTVPASSAASTASDRPTARALPAEPARLALGTNPPSNGLDAHLIAIGTPPPGANTAPAHAASNDATSNVAASNDAASNDAASEPKTVFLGLGSYVRPARRATNPPRPRASLALAVILGVLALAIAPFAPLTWIYAAEQLELIARGAYRPRGKHVLHVVQGIGIAMTMVAVAATAFAFTVLVVR